MRYPVAIADVSDAGARLVWLAANSPGRTRTRRSTNYSRCKRSRPYRSTPVDPDRRRAGSTTRRGLRPGKGQGYGIPDSKTSFGGILRLITSVALALAGCVACLALPACSAHQPASTEL